jgi:hypothetical protein
LPATFQPIVKPANATNSNSRMLVTIGGHNSSALEDRRHAAGQRDTGDAASEGHRTVRGEFARRTCRR